MLFIFTIGMQAGPGFIHSFKSKRKTLAMITLLILASAALTGIGFKYLFDIDTPSIVGLMAGALTCTPGLAVADSMTDSNIPSVAYAMVYPIAMVFLIICIQLVSMLI